MFAGVGMSIVLLTLSLMGNYEVGYIKFLKYVVLFAILIIAANKAKDYFSESEFFTKSLMNGLRISIIGGVILGITTLLIFGIFPEAAPMKFNLIPKNWFDATAIAGMFLFESAALGFIFNLIVLQFLKRGPKEMSEV